MTREETLKKEIEEKFLKVRGWKNWKEYDEIQESDEGVIGRREELIDICITSTKQKITEQNNQPALCIDSNNKTYNILTDCNFWQNDCKFYLEGNQ